MPERSLRSRHCGKMGRVCRSNFLFSRFAIARDAWSASAPFCATSQSGSRRSRPSARNWLPSGQAAPRPIEDQDRPDLVASSGADEVTERDRKDALPACSTASVWTTDVGSARLVHDLDRLKVILAAAGRAKNAKRHFAWALSPCAPIGRPPLRRVTVACDEVVFTIPSVSERPPSRSALQFSPNRRTNHVFMRWVRTA